LVVCVFIVATGCSRKPKPEVAPPPDTTESQAPPVTPSDTGTQIQTPAAPTVELRDVFFDYDKAAIRDDARSTLNENGKSLMNVSTVSVLLEGHCDERGTVEYNLALGQRRADSVKNYLVQYGVDGSRISTISYGEERPFATGSDEGAWSQNRRVHFVKQ